MGQTRILDSVLRSIAEGYQDQLLQYQKMEDLALEQKGAIEESDFSRLESIITKRQEIIRSIEGLNKGLLPLKEEITETLGLGSFTSKSILEKVPGIGSQELDLVLDQIIQIIQRIKSMDMENEKLLEEKLKGVKDDLKDIQSKKKVSKAYGSIGKYQDASFFDTNK